MEMMTVVSGVLVLVLALAFWVWWNDGNTWEPLWRRVRHRFRAAVGAVSREEMHVLQERLQEKEQQWETRLTKLEVAAKFSHQLQYVLKEINRRLTKLEEPEDPNKSTDPPGPVLKPRSLVRLGVRVTLSDVLWANLGTDHADGIEDHLIDAMIQGPFCPVCLKRVVGRDRHRKFSEVPAQCRYCRFSWDSSGTIEYPQSVIDFKRMVYQQLDQEFRAGKPMS